MCGRFSITKQESDIEQRFGATFYSDKYEPEFNVYPGKLLPIITNNEPKLVRFHRWGFTYHWTKSPIINSRSDKLVNSRVFKNLFKGKRCIIPSDGFYEWKAVQVDGKRKKIPYRIRLKGDKIFAFAGIWDICTNKIGNQEVSFSIITVEPNNLMKDIHNRMPAILEAAYEKHWLEGDFNESELLDILKPYSEEAMETFEVSPLVNNPENNFKEILLPVN